MSKKLPALVVGFVLIGALLFSRALRTALVGEQLAGLGVGVTECFFVVLFSGLLFAVWRRWRDADVWFRAGAISACLFSLAAAVAFWRWRDAHQAIVTFTVYLEWTAAFSLFFLLRPTAAALRIIIIISGLLLALSVIADTQGWFDVGMFGRFAVPYRQPVIRPAGWMASRNYAAEYLALTLPAALVTPALWPIAFLEAVAAGWTHCRTAYLAIVVEIIFLVASAPRKRTYWGAALVLAIGLSLPAFLPARLQWASSHSLASSWQRLFAFDDGSGKLRWLQLKELVDFAGRASVRLAGLGMGNFQSLMSQIDHPLAMNTYPSCDYLRVWCDAGVVAALSLFSLLAFAWVRALRSIARSPAWAATVAGLMVLCLGDVPFFRAETTLMAVAILCTALSARDQNHSSC